MAFQVAEVEVKKSSVPIACISYMRPLIRGKKGGQPGAGRHAPGARPVLRISMPIIICAVSKKKQFQLELGTGTDYRKARIVGTNAANKHTVEPSQLKHTWIFKFGFLPSLGMDAWDGEHALITRIDDNTFEFDLPECWDTTPPQKALAPKK